MPLVPASPSDRFASRVFLFAGIVGLIELLPLYFAEDAIGSLTPPAITHPDIYYGFIGIAVAWQVAFIIMSRDPERYRPLFPALFLEKLLYPVGAFVLCAMGRIPSLALGGAIIDMVWLALFVSIWVRR